MKKIAVLFIACCLTLPTLSQTDPRIPITTITPSENTGQDYTPWLNDNEDSLVQDAWQDNFKWVDVRLDLQQKSLVSKLVFFDGSGTFTDKPAYIYALNGSERIFLGLFTGPTFRTYVDLNLANPILADAIIIHKYSNNIPQKVRVFGQPYTDTTIVPETKLIFTGAIPSENTGQDYNLWFNPDLDSTIPWGNQASFKYIDVMLPLQQRSLVKRFSFWDTEGEFSTNPCYFYAVKGKQKTFIGTFVGPTFNTWVDLVLPEGVTADSILVHKYSRYIPQKINAYGIPVLTDPLDTIVPFDGRITITAAISNPNTGMDFSPWLNDKLDSLVASSGNADNFQYTDVLLPFESRHKVGRISLYDYEGVFTEQPAYIYAQDDTTKTLLGTFDGHTFKTFVEIVPTDSVFATSLIVRKYGNNIPQKIKAYGYPAPVNISPTDSIPTNVPPIDSLLVKIPIEGKRWYQLNNSSNGLSGLTDGVTDQMVNTGYGRIFNNYDAYYPVKEGEEITISKVKFYDGEGALGDYPITLSVITDSGTRIPVATFIGDRYNAWVGPYPNRETTDANKFILDSTIKNIRYIVLNCWYQFPTEMELYGTYKAPDTTTHYIKKPVKFKDVLGINAFEWNFESPWFTMVIDEGLMKAVKNFKGVRHYMDWEKLESTEGGYTFSPVHSGGWSYDAIYERCKADSIEVLACLKTIPGWMRDTYPDGERDPENVPVRYGSDFSNPMSYIEQAKLGFQYIARYGSNTQVPLNLLSVKTTKRWPNDDVNEIKVGLGLIKYIECDNERDKWWKGRKGYQTAYEYAANLSAFYDGNKNTMGPGVGVKNADPTIKVVMAGLASPNSDYVRGMVEWCRVNRGYKADGTVNLCWDIMNYHHYSNDSRNSQNGYSTRGVAPEVSEADSVAAAFLQVSHEYAQDMPVWITELGYDDNQGSPIKAIPVGNRTHEQTKADWTLRSALLYARAGIEKAFFYQLYDDNAQNPTQFGSSGLINQDTTRKPAADFIFQAGKLIGEYNYVQTLNADPLVDKYELDGKEAYALWIPDEKGRTGSYDLDLGTDSALIYTLVIGSDFMDIQKVKTDNGKLHITVTETPVFVLPVYAQVISNLRRAAPAPSILSEETATSGFNVYPNPTTGSIKIIISTEDISKPVSVQVIQPSTGKIYKTFQFKKTGKNLTETIPLNSLTNGFYFVEVRQGNTAYVKKIFKAGN